MKRKNILFIIITILMLTTTNTVQAAYEKKAAMIGHISYDNLQMVNLDTVADPYKFYQYNFHDNATGKQYVAYCISPDYTGKSSFEVTCDVANPSTYSASYYLVKKHGHPGVQDLTLNLAMRATGSGDLDYENNFSGENLDDDHEWRMAFTASRVYYAGFQCRTETAAGRDCNKDDFIMKSPTAQTAFSWYLDAMANTLAYRKSGSSGIDVSQTTDAGTLTEASGGAGKLVKADVLEVREDESGGAKTVVYTLTNISGAPITRIKATPTGNVVASISEWDGMQGKLVVTPTSTTDCSGEVIISAADLQSGTVSGETLYMCKSNGETNQKFLVVGPDLVGDRFQVKIDCDECDNDCGIVKAPGELKTFTGNNCCEPGGQKDFAQYGMNELFCKDKKLDVEFYKLKCGAGAYLADQIDELFCEWYCSQSMHYDLPGPTHAKSGRYFQLAKGSHGVSGPYLMQYKRCRTRIHWNVWYKKYYEAVEKQVEGYNQHQENKAYQMVWEKLIEIQENNKMSMNGEYGSSVTCEWAYEWEVKCTDYSQAGNPTTTTSGGNSGAPSQGIDDVQAKTYKFSYIPASNGDYTYNIVKIKADGLPDEMASEWGKEYSYLDIIYDSTKDPSDGTRYIHKDDAERWEENWQKTHDQVEGVAMSQYLATKGQLPSSSTSGATSCSVSVTNDKAPECDEKPQPATKVIPEEKVNHYKSLKEQGNTKFTGGTEEAKDYEERLTRCDKYGQENVDISTAPEMNFSYTQSYINDFGSVQTDEAVIPFTKTCSSAKHHGASFDGASGNFGGDDDKFSGKHYKEGKDKVTDFAGSMPDALDEPGSPRAIVEVHKDGEYEAEKQFTTDDVATMECMWDDSTKNRAYTLVPSGTVGYTETENFTAHDREYFVRRTHLEGEFETYFTLSDVGEDSFWDEFLEQGNTCAGDEPGKNATCKFIIDDEIIETAKCNTLQTPASDPCNCEWPNRKCGQVDTLYDFKEANPSDLFVNENVFGGNIAHNWFVDDEGKAALARIEADGKADKTYSPERLTYSFILTNEDLKAIRQYNKGRLYKGGYTDFELYCKDGTYKNGNTYSERCYSRFIDAISGGTSIDGLSLNTFNGDLNAVRNRLTWNH